jgi:hypothetical protein
MDEIKNTEKEIEDLVAKKNAEGLTPPEEEALTKLRIYQKFSFQLVT